MRRSVCLVSVPLAVLLAACGGGSDSGSKTKSSGSASPTSASPSPVTAAQLDAALLAAADLGAGWTATAPEDPDDNETPSATPTGVCDLESIGEENVRLDRTVDLENEESGTFVSHEVEVYEPGKATAAIETARDIFTQCTEFTETDGEGGTFSMKTSPFAAAPKLGDESLAYKLSATVGGQTLTGAMIVFRKGDYVAALMGLSATQNPEDYLSAAATKAEGKLPA